METYQNDRAYALSHEDIPHLLKRFAIPSIIAMLVTALYNIVDQIFIGHGVGMLGNAATNVSFPLTTVCTSLVLLLGLGGAACFNLSLGAGDSESAGRYVGNSLASLAICGVLLMLLTQCFLRPLMVFFGATENVLPYAMTYTRITSYGFPLLIIANSCCHLIRADGSPSYSMICMLTGAVLNAILDPIFIFVFDMGIGGAAWATTISQAVSCVMAVGYLKKFRLVTLKRSYFIPNGALLCRTAAVGAGGCFNQLSLMLVQIVLNNTLTAYGAQSAYGSDIPLACAGIIAKVNMIVLALVIGVAQGAQPIISYNYGAKDYTRVRKAFLLALSSATVISIVGFICFQVFPRQIIALFGGGSEELYTFATQYFRIYLFMTFVNGLHPVVTNFFTSIGKAILGLILSLTRQILFLVPLILLLPRLFGIDGVMYAGPIADSFAALLAGFLVIRELRRMKALQASLTLETPACPL